MVKVATGSPLGSEITTAEIADGAVTTAKLANAAVTPAKLASSAQVAVIRALTVPSLSNMATFGSSTTAGLHFSTIASRMSLLLDTPVQGTYAENVAPNSGSGTANTLTDKINTDVTRYTGTELSGAYQKLITLTNNTGSTKYGIICAVTSSAASRMKVLHQNTTTLLETDGSTTNIGIIAIKSLSAGQTMELYGHDGGGAVNMDVVLACLCSDVPARFFSTASSGVHYYSDLADNIAGTMIAAGGQILFTESLANDLANFATVCVDSDSGIGNYLSASVSTTNAAWVTSVDYYT